MTSFTKVIRKVTFTFFLSFSLLQRQHRLKRNILITNESSFAGRGMEKSTKYVTNLFIMLSDVKQSFKDLSDVNMDCGLVSSLSEKYVSSGEMNFAPVYSVQWVPITLVDASGKLSYKQYIS